MRSRVTAYVVSFIAVSLSAVSLPTLGWAASGGAAITGPAGGGAHHGQSPVSVAVGVVQPANVAVSVVGHRMSIATRASVSFGNPLRVSGSAPAGAAGRVVELQRGGQQTGWKWMQTADARVGSDGSFSIIWRTNHAGRFAIRAVVIGVHAVRSSPAVTTTVYRLTIATQYGPGFYGNTTACGEVLRTGTLGVANRTLPCGTLVAIYYGGRSIVVPVIDRGPYANNANFDLTEATGRKLGMGGIATIGAVSLPIRR